MWSARRTTWASISARVAQLLPTAHTSAPSARSMPSNTGVGLLVAVMTIGKSLAASCGRSTGRTSMPSRADISSANWQRSRPVRLYTYATLSLRASGPLPAASGLAGRRRTCRLRSLHGRPATRPPRRSWRRSATGPGDRLRSALRADPWRHHRCPPKTARRRASWRRSSSRPCPGRRPRRSCCAAPRREPGPGRGERCRPCRPPSWRKASSIASIAILRSTSSCTSDSVSRIAMPQTSPYGSSPSGPPVPRLQSRDPSRDYNAAPPRPAQRLLACAKPLGRPILADAGRRTTRPAADFVRARGPGLKFIGQRGGRAIISN